MQAEPAKAAPPKRQRREFQFSLRTLLIVVTLLAVTSACLSWWAWPAQERDPVFRRILELDGTIFVNSQDHLYLIILPATTRAEDRRAIRAAFPGVEIMAFNPGERRRFPFPDDAPQALHLP
jgi:hypothetical protein